MKEDKQETCDCCWEAADQYDECTICGNMICDNCINGTEGTAVCNDCVGSPEAA